MKIKTQDLIGAQLDWAVAKCEGVARPYIKDGYCQRGTDFCGNVEFICYSTDWAQGGPIIEEKEIGIRRNAPCSRGREWEASPSITAKGAGGRWGYGPTPLIAAMRAYVTSKLGDEVEVPEELE